MAHADLRSFLAQYEENFPQEVIRIQRPVRAEFEATAIARRFEELGKFPVIIFEQVILPKGQTAPFPCLIYLTADRKRLAYAIGSTYDDVGLDWSRRVASERRPPVVVDPGEAPCKEQTYRGDEVDLLQLPALRHHEMDPGQYITAGMFTCYHPQRGMDNVAYHRGFICGRRELRCYLTPQSHAGLNLRAHWEANRQMKVAYWVGHHPAALMGVHTIGGYPESHYGAAGALLGEPLRLVPSETLGEEFLIPAEAEFVIEGVMRPGRVDVEGPFGEYPRYYGPQRLNPVFEVTALTHRRGAIWHSHMVGINNVYGGLPREAHLYEEVKKAVPQVQRVHVPVSGAGGFHAYIQLKKTHDGQPREAIMAALSGSNYIKHVVVVDEDIDIYDDRWVLWAIATRSQWDRDLVVVPGCIGTALDPSGEREGITTKAGIDATKPAPPQRYPMHLTIPAEVEEKVHLEDYVEPERIRQVSDYHHRR